MHKNVSLCIYLLTHGSRVCIVKILCERKGKEYL
jgi:hypothetical protein